MNKRQLGFWSIVLLGINGIIGSGIFLLPNVGMKNFGPASVLVLVFDAILAFSIGLCFAEASGLFDKTGGPYLYAKAAFGNFIGYEVGFVTWAIRIIAEATMYVAFATALGGMFTNLNTPLIKNMIVTVIAILLMIMNMSGVKLTSAVNNTVTVAKLLPILLVIMTGLFAINGANFDPFFITKLTTPHNFSTTALTMFYIFTGFEGLVVAAGEMKDPEKNLPRALVIVLLTVAAVYILVQAVCIGVLGSGLINTQVPLQTTIEHVIGRTGGAIVGAGTLISIGGICVASSFITPRSGVAMAEQKMMPTILAKTNKRQAPYVAIIVSTLLALIIAYSGTFSVLAQISAVSRFAQFIPTVLAVMVFRKTKANAPRAFKVPFGWTVPIIALVISAWLLINTDVTSLLWGFGALVVAVPFYFLTYKMRKNVV